MASRTIRPNLAKLSGSVAYRAILGEVSALLESARRAAARAVNTVMTTTYWEIGRRLVEHEQRGRARAAYGAALLRRLSKDLAGRFGRGFSERNLEQMQRFYLTWPISQTLSSKFQEGPALAPRSKISQTLSAKSQDHIAPSFPLPWSHYVRLLAVRNENARAFYEYEALRGGWTARQLDRHLKARDVPT